MPFICDDARSPAENAKPPLFFSLNKQTFVVGVRLPPNPVQPFSFMAESVATTMAIRKTGHFMHPAGVRR